MILPLKENIIELREVSFQYPDGSIGLARCSLTIKRSGRTAVLGVNGSGKTTLFLHLNGILRPQTGQISFNGVPLDYGRKGLRNLRSSIGFVFQNPDAQLFSASVREDVSFGPMNLGMDRETIRNNVEESLAAVGLTALADKPVHHLSYGQKKRVCIAGVLAMKPEVMILDEPMAGLDVPMQLTLFNLLEHLHKSGMTIVIASHDLDFAYQWADTVHFLKGGTKSATWEPAVSPQPSDWPSITASRMPRVAEVYGLLAKAGLIHDTDPPPRSHEALLLTIEKALSTR